MVVSRAASRGIALLFLGILVTAGPTPAGRPEPGLHEVRPVIGAPVGTVRRLHARLAVRRAVEALDRGAGRTGRVAARLLAVGRSEVVAAMTEVGARAGRWAAAAPASVDAAPEAPGAPMAEASSRTAARAGAARSVRVALAYRAGAPLADRLRDWAVTPAEAQAGGAPTLAVRLDEGDGPLGDLFANHPREPAVRQFVIGLDGPRGAGIQAGIGIDPGTLLGVQAAKDAPVVDPGALGHPFFGQVDAARGAAAGLDLAGVRVAVAGFAAEPGSPRAWGVGASATYQGGAGLVLRLDGGALTRQGTATTGFAGLGASWRLAPRLEASATVHLGGGAGGVADAASLALDARSVARDDDRLSLALVRPARSDGVGRRRVDLQGAYELPLGEAGAFVAGIAAEDVGNGAPAATALARVGIRF